MANKRSLDTQMDRVDQLLRPSPLVVPVVGAGVAQSAGLPGSSELAKRLLAASAHEPKYSGSPESLDEVIDFLVRTDGDESALLSATAAELAACPAEPSPLVEALIRIPSRFIVTLNFDLTLEEADRRRGHSPLTLGNGSEDLAEAIRVLATGQPPPNLTVLHLHGSVERPAEIVLAADGYKRLASEPFGQLLRELAVHRTMVFYGTTLDEPHLLAELQKIEARSPHVLWCLASEEAGLKGGRDPILPSRSGIYVRTVREPADLPSTVQKLLHSDLPPAPPVLVPRAADDRELYVENRLLDRRDPNDPQDLALASLGLEPKKGLRPDPTEADVLDAQRTIVLGEPGTGKSELLKQLMRKTTPPRHGVFIRLADVELDSRSGPRQTLAAWASQGASAEADLDVSVDALAQDRYHFFLDGLDEVRSDRQAEVAERVNRLAEEFPRHAFTVSTRPLPSLELLQIEAPEAMDWNQFTLAPDAQWRDRFLARRGVSLRELYEDMPTLEDMADILTTPFYLDRIVDLHLRGRLRGLPDFSQLLSALLDAAVAKEQGALGLKDSAVRDWLRDLALAALLAGHRTFSEQALRRLAPPPGSDADVLDLARALEQRLLLAEDRGSFRFHHRLLGEQLGAEALRERGPLPELLECLVPYIDEELSGVRPDAVVPVSLVCLDSAQWRRAVSERDPLLAARSTPSAAPHEEREDALRALWRNATDKQVWVWERGMQLTDDADAMGRLLRTIPDSPVATEIAAALARGTDQDQGNAIRVLARARPAGFESMLADVLGDPGRSNEVVLRQAVLAAADCGFADLIEDIVEMLLREAEETVHQIGIAALRNLFGDEPRLDLCLRLMASPEAGYLIALVLEDLKPPEAVLLLAEYLRCGNDDGHDPFWAKEKVPAAFDGLELDGLDPAILEAAVDVAVGFELDEERISAFAAADSAVVTRRLAELFSDHELRWWKAIELAALFDPDDLASAGVPDHVVERVRMRRRIDAVGPGATSGVPSGHGEATEDDDGDAEGESPTLAELLDEGEETDALILNNTRYFEPQVAELTAEQRDELRARLMRWWPQGPYLETITRTSSNSWRQEAGAHAWICFGPEAKPDLDPERWAQLATCGILFESQTSWLREAHTLEGISRAVELLDGEGDLERWEQLLSCCVDPLPDRVLLACARSLDPSLTEGSDVARYRLRAIAGRMIDNGRADLAKDLAARHPDFATDLAPILAERGDLDAQRQLIFTLVEQLSEDEMPGDGCVEWLPGIRSPELLDGLFDVVRQSYGPQLDRGTRIRGFDRNDIARAAMEAIAAIGGHAAVDGYDQLITAGDDFRWLRYQRSQVASAALGVEGERFATLAAARVELPLLGTPNDPARD